MSDADNHSHDAQDAAIDLADAVGSFDSALLARTSAAQRVQQLYARQVLYDFADAMWDDIKARGLDKIQEQYAGIRGLAAELVTAAEVAIHKAREDPDAVLNYNPDQARHAEKERKAAFQKWLGGATREQIRQALETANPNDILDLAEAKALRTR
ncbi:hypothetical protein [Actinopolymorpha alba]|uniref:hypothetical protein n=1 Tax=Actinopolymorpha alba TaxID=533267 RepID=UPI00037555C2|nr:hypothetical protein [Actinopolymorpha alba]